MRRGVANHPGSARKLITSSSSACALATAARRRLSFDVVSVFAIWDRQKYGSAALHRRKTLQVAPVAANNFTRSHPFDVLLKGETAVMPGNARRRSE